MELLAGGSRVWLRAQKQWASLIVLLGLLLVSPALAEETQFYTNSSLLWGPYRPNLYFGIRPRIPKTLLMGLMWADADNDAQLQADLRHTSDHDEGMAGYGWTTFDPRTGGTQIFRDARNKVDLNVTFAKDADDPTGDRWGLRITGTMRPDAATTQRTRVIFHIGTEGKDSTVKCVPSEKNPPKYAMYTLCTGDLPEVPNYQVEILPNLQKDNGKDHAVATISSFRIPGDNVWPVKSIFLGQLQKPDPSTKVAGSAANLQVVDVTYDGDFDCDILFTTGTASGKTSIVESSASLDRNIETANDAFETRFKAVYQPQAPFDGPEYVDFSKQLLSNLLGGIGYFHGKSLVNPKADAMKLTHGEVDGAAEERGPYSLFTAVPSRPYFPRGFLWDEGFHLQVILDWDMDLALDILTSWLDTIDENGWMPREQILGPEARRKVPLEFQTQYQSDANPPTIYLVIDMYVDRLNRAEPYHGAPSKHLKDMDAGVAFLQGIYPKLQAYYEWYRRTLAGNIDAYQYLRPALKENFSEGYRWRGRSGQHLLASGLDDYPRFKTPSDYELHVDALSWITIVANAMRKAAIVLGKRYDPAGDAFTYDTHALKAGEAAGGIHWSETNRAYCDATISRSSGKLQHICHKGYVSLMPFMADTIFPLSLERGHVSEILDLITDPKELWSPYGIRSLSKRDKYYGTGENYWRSPIWVNMNYLVLTRLLSMAEKDGKYKRRAMKIYTELRKNIVNTVFNCWNQTGTVWENYDPDNGHGQGRSHFTGWTSLVVRIMAMPDFSANLVGSDGNEVALHPPQTFSSSVDLSQESMIFFGLLLLACIIFRRALLAVWRSVGELFRK